MYRFTIKLCCYIILLLLPVLAFGQEEAYDDLLQRVDTIENPVYKPVVALSYGVLNFRGDVKNSSMSYAIGNPAFKFNIATFVDKKQNFTANFNFLLGKLNGNQYSFTDLEKNLNFQSDVYSIGVNLEYRFGHLIDKRFPIRPYISLGVENVNFSAKGDLVDKDGLQYHYWSDGTIRDRDENALGTPGILYRDYNYETDLRKREREDFNLGTYSQRSLAIPIDAGLQFQVNERAFLSLGISYHYTFTDYIDNVAYEGTSVKGAKGNDGYFFSHIGIHFDLFSDPETRTVDLLYADVDFDPLFYDDEDGDFVLDPADHCPGTPYGVSVDTLGCPLDGDDDGVPDYRDDEPDTRQGKWVDERGVTQSEDAFYASLRREPAMKREDVKSYLDMIEGNYTLSSSTVIPDKFKLLDTDGDGYISFDELLKTIDAYFDFKLELSIEELREVNEFFFSQ